MSEIRAELCGGPLDGEHVTFDTDDSPGDVRYPVYDGDDLLYRPTRRRTVAGRVVYELARLESAR